MVIQFIYSLIFYLYLDNEIYHFPSFLTIKKKKKKKKDNYTKPTCDLGENLFAYPWFEKYHLTHLCYVPFVFRNPPLLKSRVNMYFCSKFMSLSSQNKK